MFSVDSWSTPNSSFRLEDNSTVSSKATSLIDVIKVREERCLQTGRWLGTIFGSTMGVMQIFWSATGVSGIHGSFGENLVTGIPSAVIGGYVGKRTTEWATRQIMKGKPKPFKAAFRGALYGAVDGTITLASSMIPLLLIGYYMETIHFNLNRDMIVLKLLGASVLGGALYGGTFGAVVGVVYGPCISLYMKF